MEISFKGTKALVTGAGKGIGRDICKMLVRCGAEVYAVSRTKEDLDSLVQEVPAINPVCADLGDMESLKGAIEPLQGIELLVNNAGVASLEPFLEITPGEFDRIINVNLKAVVFVSQIIAKKMVKNGSGGSIVNVSSQASQAALKDHACYSTSKAGVDMLSKVMALELGPHKIRVNTVNPTVVLTAMGKFAWSDPAKGGPMLAKIPLGKFAEVEDVVHAVLYLLSDKSNMISGVTLPIDGGFLAC